MVTTKDFQLALLASMLKDEDFFRSAAANLHLSDFDMAQIRLVFEISRNYMQNFDAMIPSGILWQEILAAKEGQASYKTVIADTDEALQYLVQVYKVAKEALDHPDKAESAYYRKLLPEFCNEVRIARVNDRYDLSATEKAGAIAKIAEDTARMGTQSIKFGSISDLTFEDDPGSNRVGTGVIGLDKKTNWGLKAGELAVLAGGSGVGKSVSLLNFAVANALKGIRSLIITLENPLQMYLERMCAIFGHFSPSYFNKGRPANWPDDVRQRLEYVCNVLPATKLITFLDYSTTSTSCADIEAAIAQWKHDVEMSTGSSDSCKVVYVDYLKVISPKGITGLGANPSPADTLPAICQRLGVIARKEKVVMWTAQQIQKDSKKKEVLGQEDVAFASHIIDWLDLGIGLAFVRENEFEDEDTGLESEEEDVNEDEVVDETGRKMIISVWKARSSSATDLVVPIYRGPTLKMWSSQNYASQVDVVANSMNMEGLYKMMTPKGSSS